MVGNQIIEAIMPHQSKDEQEARGSRHAERVGISRPQEGWMTIPLSSAEACAEVMIAMALSLQPKLYSR